MAPAVLLRAAVALIGRYPALAGVDLEVGRGEVVLLHGPNGAGKTSLLRVCAGLLGLSEGEAQVLGEDLRLDRRSVRRRVGYLGHSGPLYEDLTVEENVRFAVRAAGGDPSAVRPALGRLDLDGRLARSPVSRLSAGQRRRVPLAGLLARSPELWLLDEPHAGLDAKARDALDALVAEAAGSGSTVLLASHELERAAALSDRVVTLAGGHVQRSSGGRPAAQEVPLASASRGQPLNVA
jgi:heme ABC exporter ATP-binding subunit CcmA